MAKLIYGDRIAKQGKILVGCSAIIFDDTQQKMLVTKRTDNGQWCLPGGRIDPRENVAECCIREVLEETGLHVKIKRLTGIYSNPNILVKYSDNSLNHSVTLSFEVEVIGGKLGLSSETTDYGYYSFDEMETMDLMDLDRKRMIDAFARQTDPFIR